MSKPARQRAAIQRNLDDETRRERQRILDAHFPGGATTTQRAMIDVVAKAAVYRLQIARLNHSLGWTGQPEALPPANRWVEVYRETCAALNIPPVLLTEMEGQS